MKIGLWSSLFTSCPGNSAVVVVVEEEKAALKKQAAALQVAWRLKIVDRGRAKPLMYSKLFGLLAEFGRQGSWWMRREQSWAALMGSGCWGTEAVWSFVLRALGEGGGPLLDLKKVFVCFWLSCFLEVVSFTAGGECAEYNVEGECVRGKSDFSQ